MNNKLDGATVTEAHRKLAADLCRHATGSNRALHHVPKFAQLIADSEAKACDQLRAELADQAARFHDEIARRQEVVRANKELDLLERDQLRAEVKRLKNQRDNLLKPMRDEAFARAERAEAELEEARKDSKRYRYIAWKSDTNPIMIIKLNDNILLHGYDANEAIDAAMKGETK